MVTKIFACAAFATLAFTSQSIACGAQTDCKIGDRHYRIHMPAGHDASHPLGAIIFTHGYKGTAKGAMNNSNLTQLADDLGVALIATKSAKDDWSIPGAPSSVTDPDVDELAYYDTVLADVTAKFPVDPDQLMLTGFSAGAMMVWNLACHRSEKFAGFVPMSGTFWQPEPLTCDTPPANVIHIHGTTDKIVPLEGRKVLDTHQGSVSDVLEMYGRYGAFSDTGKASLGELACDTQANAAGDILNYCTFDGGHTFKAEYLKSAWDLLATTGKL
nr:alpha/beta hydrolase-fold protein [Epibacterium ulvae]